jgi:hypothetical protein
MGLDKDETLRMVVTDTMENARKLAQLTSRRVGTVSKGPMKDILSNHPGVVFTCTDKTFSDEHFALGYCTEELASEDETIKYIFKYKLVGTEWVGEKNWRSK